KLKISRQQALDLTAESVRLARSHVDDVEFSPEDATRSDRDFLVEMVRVAIEAGATTINMPDTVGYSTPEEYGQMFLEVRSRVPAIDAEGIVLSSHCHDDLGLAVANSLAAISAGARQVECTINGIGERAGNASLEEIAVALHVRQSRYSCATNISLEKIYSTSRLLTSITGVSVPPNKAVVGANAFAHEAGIHQDGMLKNPLTYEIILPEKVGVPARRLVLGKHSGRHALRISLTELGYDPNDAELAECYRRVTTLADASKQVRARDLMTIAHEVMRRKAVPVPSEAASAL